MNERARVCMLSQRGVIRQVAWCANYEFEDVACEVDRIDLLSIEPGVAYNARSRILRSMIWYPLLRDVSRHLNPGVKRHVLQQNYELFVYVCMNPAELIYLAGVPGWKDRCRRSVCVLAEFYKPLINFKNYRVLLGLLRQFDQIVICQANAATSLEQAVGRPVHHVPFGVDVLKFTSLARHEPRLIDVYSIGRRVNVLHEALRRMAAGGEIFYLYDTLAPELGVFVDHRQHRDVLASCARRSRFFVVHPAKVDVLEESRGESEIGARFFEGAAAGTVLVGRAPNVASFSRDFSWPEAVVDLGSTEESLRTALGRLIANPEHVSFIGHRNAIEAARKFDWAHRWREILRIVGLEPMPELMERERRLAELVAAAETSVAC